MDPQPGPSRSKDIRCRVRKDPKRSLKRYKLDKEVNSTTIDFLPNEIMVKIFKYLSIEDRLKVQKVCHGWYDIARSEILWRCVKLSGVSPSFFIVIVSTLPSGVLNLRLTCRSESLPISLPDVMAKLHMQCPFLKSLILEDIHLVKNLHYVNSFHPRQFTSCNIRLLEDAKSTLVDSLNEYIESEFCKEGEFALLNAILPELKILSLRRVLFNEFHFFSHFNTTILPKIVVLDLSHSKPISMMDNDLFSTLTELEELYLAGWNINDHTILKFLKNAKKLRVLDLESSDVSDNTVSVLKQNNIWLEELYLSLTAIGDIQRGSEDEVFFPHLNSLCVKGTHVTPGGIEKLLAACPSLKLVNISNCYKICKNWYNSLPSDTKKKLFFCKLNNGFCCDHFLKTKYYNF